MSYIEESLSAGEKVEGLFKLHWVDWLWMWLWIVLAIPTLGITLLFALYEGLKLKFQEQGVTNKRVILKKGIISRKTEEMRLKSIETVEIDQGVLGRLLGFGTVRLTGKGVSDFQLTGIADPLAVKRTIESIGNPID
jgi:uncharacterized membrane protein YdbT with pleckstrin-like domain